jgi:ABC-type lipoprotein release transport system permease subunit
MRYIFFIRLAVVNTFKKRLRAILAIGSIALTVSAMVALYGVEIGLRSLIDNEISSSDSRDVITITQRSNREVRLNDSQLSKLQSISGVSQIGHSVGLAGLAIYHGISLNMPIYAISDDYFSLSPNKSTTGKLPTAIGESGIVVSKKTLAVMGIKETEAIGKKIKVDIAITASYFNGVGLDGERLGAKEYEIKAIIDRGELPVLFIAIEPLRAKGLDNVSQVKVRITTPDKALTVRETIERMGLQTNSIQDTIDQIDKLFTVVNNTLLVFTVIVFVVTISGVFTVISLTLIEETRQIGFLRIVGLRSMDVRTLFVIQSMVLTALGALVGVISGSVLGMVVNGIAKATASSESFSGDISIFIIPVQAIIMILMLSIVIGWLVGIVPAKRAVLIDPLEELRL